MKHIRLIRVGHYTINVNQIVKITPTLSGDGSLVMYRSKDFPSGLVAAGVPESPLTIQALVNEVCKYGD